MQVVAVDAVSSEPVSVPNSLLYGKKQGIIAKLGDFRQKPLGIAT